jgi:subtilisin family serine protease
VEYAQPNYLIYAMEGEHPDESPQSIARPRIGQRPADGPFVRDPLTGYTWGMVKIGVGQAWQQQRGSRSVVVAVIDSGVDYNHPDLAANIWRNPKAAQMEATGVDEDGLGYNDIVGWDFVHNDNLPYDDNNHGTHVAGTIGAVGGNGIGVSGVSQRVSIMAVKFLDASGTGDTANAIRGINYAVSRGAKVLNNSWGGGGYNTALRDAIQRSADAGALFVVAAGNDGSNNDYSPIYPASFNVPNIITVAATTSSDTLASFSNTGARSVHLAAPGQGIYSTVPGGRYATMSGTSMAAPHVSGAAALVWAQYPNASAREIKNRLINSGDYLRTLSGRTISGRRLNVRRALQ